jgi:putative methyltransferase (TIGR04325 family)
VPRDDLGSQQSVLAFGYVLALAARGKTRLSMLDWGGGPGHYAVLARALIPDVELDYHSRDLPPLAALGRELLPEDSFHSDDSVLGRRYDLVVASSSLQYAEDWHSTLAALAAATQVYLYVTRLPVALTAASFVVLQRAQAYGYETEYLGWVVNRDELLEQAAAAGLTLVREVILPAWLSAAGAPEEPVGHRGFLFAPG